MSAGGLAVISALAWFFFIARVAKERRRRFRALQDHVSRHSAVHVCQSAGVVDPDLTRLNLDVYQTREGPWNPEHGDLEIPDNWEFLPAGDAFVTRRVKAAGIYWVAWRLRSRNRRHRRRLGLWAPRDAIAHAQAEAEVSAEERAKRRRQSARHRERQEAWYQEDLSRAIRDFLDLAPEHAELAEEIAEKAAARAAEVGSGRVGRTRTLPVGERAALAARAFIRHRHTSYEEALMDWGFGGPWDDDFLYREVKAEAQAAVDEFLERHRRGEH